MPEDSSSKAETPKPPSRYERVKQILNKAQGDCTPNYQGYGRFWDLPLEQFLEVVIYGVRMIAPEKGSDDDSSGCCPPPAPSPQSSCCHAPAQSAATASGAQAQAGSGARPGRGAASGLIIGLKGQCPFDGTQFPRLPWDGTAVSDSDIQFIEKWIDDGCPADDSARSQVQVHENMVQARARGDAEHPLLTGSANRFHEDKGGAKVRKNVAFLLPEELQRFRCAIAWMKSFDNYYQDERSFGYWARIHANLCQHGWEEFLTWHRIYLYFFELQLQDYDSSVTLPYWDWTGGADEKNVEASIFDMQQANPSSKTDNGVIPEPYRCYMDAAGIEALKKGGVVSAGDLAKLESILNKPYNSGLRLFDAAKIPYGQNPASDYAILDQLGKINPLWHRYRWPGGDQGLIFQSYPTTGDVQRILELPNFFDFGSGPSSNHFFGALENIHNLIHNFSGGANPHYVMGTQPENRIEPQSGDMVFAGLTAYDPIFWGHHSNVDRLWAEWQQKHRGSGPDNPSAILPPWTMTVDQSYSIHDLGYEYMLSSHLYPTESSVAIAKFKSAPANVQPAVLDRHRRAEVRLHQVQYVQRAGFHIRVFLNSPNANASTPTRGNDNFVGQVNTFTGFCVGGPGHCELPKEPRRKFDKRPRPHKSPGSFRLDATNVVEKLMDKGATDFHVNLVVLNTDGTLATDALKLDAVSLNFID